MVLLTSCSAHHPAIPPDVIHARAHSGGSVVTFSQSGDLLASGGWEGNVHVWRMPGGDAFSYWHAHRDSINGLVFVEHDRHIITAGYDGRLARWTLGGVQLGEARTPAPITHMVADAGSNRLITGHDDGSVRIWRVSDFRLLAERKLHDGAVRAVAMDPLTLRYASSGSDGAVYMWVEGGTVTQLEGPPTDAWTLAFTPDGSRLYGGGWFRLYRWNPDDGSLVILPTDHHGIIKAIQFVEDGHELASISRQTDSAVYFLDPVTGAAVRRFQQHELCGASVAVSPHGRYLATTSDDASVRIWKLAPALTR
jgi:WD40 repeat protein